MKTTSPGPGDRVYSTPPRSVRTFLLWLVLACLLPGVIGTTILFIHQYTQGRAQQNKDTIRTARALIGAVDTHLLRAQTVGETLATHDALIHGDLKEFHGRIQQAVNTSDLIANIVLRGPDEQLLLNASLPFGTPLPIQPTREHVRRVFLTGQSAVSDLFEVPQFSHPIISVDVPVLIRGEPVYSLGISIFPQDINTLLLAQNLPQDWVVTVLDNSDTVVARNLMPEKFVGSKAPSSLRQGLSQFQEASIEGLTLEGAAAQISFSQSPATGWAVALSIPLQSLQQGLIQSLAKLGALVTSMFALGLALAWLAGGKIATSVRALTGLAVALGKGESFKFSNTNIREVNEVARAMERSADLLKERTTTLRLREAEVKEAYALLRNVIDSTPVLIYLKDFSGRLILANKSYENLIGSAPRRVNAESGSRFAASSEEMTGPSAADVQVMENGGTIQFEEELETQEGVRYFAISKAPLRTPEGRMTGICAAAVDITPLKVAEARIQVLVQTLERRVEQRTEELNHANAHLQQTNAQLALANDQLEAFSYTVAHDLRAPLRGINGFADAVIEDYQDLLDDTAHDYLGRITKAATRMERLIEDLLKFSRLSRVEFSIGTVSIDDVLKEALSNLSSEIQESCADITVAPDLPFVRANQTVCTQAFQNLISNAIKFAKAGTPPSIRIWSENGQDDRDAPCIARIWVEDKGIGIPVSHLERIFRPFERLHGIDEYQGSGIGLAIVATAVHRMGGRCGVQSEVGLGSRFWVELPAVNMDEK